MKTSDKEWQRVTTNGNEWYNEWKQVPQQVTMSDNEWQRVVIAANFSFFRIREEPTTKHPKENSLNLEETLKNEQKTPLRRNINSKKQELRKFFVCSWYLQL